MYKVYGNVLSTGTKERIIEVLGGFGHSRMRVHVYPNRQGLLTKENYRSLVGGEVVGWLLCIKQWDMPEKNVANNSGKPIGGPRFTCIHKRAFVYGVNRGLITKEDNGSTIGGYCLQMASVVKCIQIKWEMLEQS